MLVFLLVAGFFLLGFVIVVVLRVGYADALASGEGKMESGRETTPRYKIVDASEANT